MPYNPNQPADNSPLSSAVMRGQLTALDADTQTRALQTDVEAAIAGTSSNTNGVGTLRMVVSDPPTQGKVQAIADKLDELINGLRR